MAGAFPGRPRVFRDPIHGDICFPKGPFQKLIEQLLDTPMFQRLRRIRQNGVMNLVFHGAEHSRLAHSMGAAHVAGWMFDTIARNTPDEVESDPKLRQRDREDTILAALLHDVGHGPFSHTLEEITKALKLDFHHEVMTIRILEEPGSDICDLLAAHDPALPRRLAAFIDKGRRDREAPLWFHSIASSQLDADRLDYLMRDAYLAGIRTHSFDLTRLIGALGVREREVVVDARARDVVDSYLLALDHMYASAYYHHTNRAASFLLTQILRRAVDLARASALDRQTLFPPIFGGTNPLWSLFEQGAKLPLHTYQHLDEALTWTHIMIWGNSSDLTLSGLVADLGSRRLPKSLAAPPSKIGKSRLKELEAQATQKFRSARPDADPKYFIGIDSPSRKTYTKGSWDDEYAGSIKLCGADGKPTALETDPLSLVNVLDERKLYPSIIVPPDLRDFVLSLM